MPRELCCPVAPSSRGIAILGDLQTQLERFQRALSSLTKGGIWLHFEQRVVPEVVTHLNSPVILQYSGLNDLYSHIIE